MQSIQSMYDSIRNKKSGEMKRSKSVTFSEACEDNSHCSSDRNHHHYKCNPNLEYDIDENGKRVYQKSISINTDVSLFPRKHTKKTLISANNSKSLILPSRKHWRCHTPNSLITDKKIVKA